MGKHTGISWADHTFNPWWGCAKVSAACKHCYAESLAHRFGMSWGATARRRFFGLAHWREPLTWNKAAERAATPAFVFVASMADVWEILPDDHPDTARVADARLRLYELVEATPWLVWLMLSKRPENARRLVPHAWMTGSWPSNVWAGATMEDQEQADERAPHLLGLPAPRHFASYEPALERVDFSAWLRGRVPDGWGPHGDPGQCPKWHDKCWCALDWIIIGGESGPKARRFDVQCAFSVLALCRYFGASPFVKQLGARPQVTEASRLSRLWAAMPGGRVDDCGGVHLADRAGADPAEWLSELRVQERPAALAILGLGL